MDGIKSRVKKLTKWAKTNDGKYALLDVPIFELLSDKIKGVDFTLEKAYQVVKNFLRDSANGFFPRAFIGHHIPKSAEQRPSVGFLDNLRFVGNRIIANVIDIDQANFGLIKLNKYPYRSVEYNDERCLITGLALLESQMPFCRFANLILEDSPVENFSLSKVERRAYMPMPDDPKNPNQNGDSTQPPNTEDTQSTDAQEAQNEPGWAKEMLSILRQLLQMEMDEKKKKEEAAYQQEQTAKDQSATSQIGKNPGSVAMQMSDFEKLQEQVKSLQQEVRGYKSSGKILERLENFCEDTGADFSMHSEILSGFSDDKSKEKYLAMIENQNFSLGVHRMTKIGNGYKTTPVDERSKMLQKYPGQNALLKKALKTYNETMAHPDEDVVKAFSVVFPTAEIFVDNVMDGSKMDPDYLDRMTMTM